MRLGRSGCRLPAHAPSSFEAELRFRLSARAPKMIDEISEASDPCELARRWTVDLDVMQRVVRAGQAFHAATGRRVQVISGYRTVARQLDLRRQGRPAAPPDVSNHTRCPSTAVDVQIGFGPTRQVIAEWGRAAVLAGLRWGGGSPVGSDGIPSDWPHVDLGPRPPGAA